MSTWPPPRYFVGIDVGTGSARAGVFDAGGRMLASAERAIAIYRVEGQPLLYQQSSEGIWRALCAVVKEALGKADAEASAGGSEAEAAVGLHVAGLSVTATCSMVVVAFDGGDNSGRRQPQDVTPTGATLVPCPEGDVTNIIMWCDHRALVEAEAITATRHPLLKHVGGVISPENEIPKLRWIKRHLPHVYGNPATRYYDLADYLSLRLAGKATATATATATASDDVRSVCCVGAKWVFDTANGRWDRTFLTAVGLTELTDAQLGAVVRRPGDAIGPLAPELAASLGITPTAVVAVGTVDAFAGVIGSIGARLREEGTPDVSLSDRLAVIMGTSTCHIGCSPSPRFVPGVWGPFRDALGNGAWVTEGGQSAAGKLLDHLLETHPAWGQLQAEAAAAGQHPQQFLHARLQTLASAAADADSGSDGKVALLAPDLHVLPHWAGSRSPDADPELTGSIVGLTFDVSLDALARLYLAGVQALALGTKHIVDAMEQAGMGPITHLFISGGLGIKNRLLLQAHADATGRALVLPGGCDEAVLLGAAVVAAVAAANAAAGGGPGSSGGLPTTIDHGMAVMTRAGEVIEPDGDARVRAYYRGKEAVYHELRELQLRARARMKQPQQPATTG